MKMKELIKELKKFDQNAIEYVADLYLEADEFPKMFWSSYEAEEELKRIKDKGKTGVIWRERDIWQVFQFSN